MANLKLNNIIIATETGGIATLQSGIIKAKDGTSSVTIADSTGAISLSSTLAVTGTSAFTGAVSLSSTLAVTGGTTFTGSFALTDEVITDLKINKNKKLKQQGAFMQSSTHQALVLGL